MPKCESIEHAATAQRVSNNKTTNKQKNILLNAHCLMYNDENGGKFKTKLFLAEINALCSPWAKITYTHAQNLAHTHLASIVWCLNTKKNAKEIRDERKKFQDISKYKPHIVWVFIRIQLWNAVDGRRVQRYVRKPCTSWTKETFVIDFYWKTFLPNSGEKKRCKMNCLVAYYCHVWEFDHFASNHFNRNQSLGRLHSKHFKWWTFILAFNLPIGRENRKIWFSASVTKCIFENRFGNII